jgi:hypothetical protein
MLNANSANPGQCFNRPLDRTSFARATRRNGELLLFKLKHDQCSFLRTEQTCDLVGRLSFGPRRLLCRPGGERPPRPNKPLAPDLALHVTPEVRKHLPHFSANGVPAQGLAAPQVRGDVSGYDQ